jgi:hypothetical protein
MPRIALFLLITCCYAETASQTEAMRTVLDDRERAIQRDDNVLDYMKAIAYYAKSDPIAREDIKRRGLIDEAVGFADKALLGPAVRADFGFRDNVLEGEASMFAAIGDTARCVALVGQTAKGKVESAIDESFAKGDTVVHSVADPQDVTFKLERGACYVLRYSFASSRAGYKMGVRDALTKWHGDWDMSWNGATSGKIDLACPFSASTATVHVEDLCRRGGGNTLTVDIYSRQIDAAALDSLEDKYNAERANNIQSQCDTCVLTYNRCVLGEVTPSRSCVEDLKRCVDLPWLKGCGVH